MTKKKTESFPLLLNHIPGKIIGNISFVDDIAKILLLEGDYRFGMGYQVLKEKIVNGIRHIEKIKLYEVSLVNATKPSVDESHCEVKND